MRLMGLDPGLRATGWGVIESRDNRLRYIADGTIQVATGPVLSDRLSELFDELAKVIELHRPDEAAVEETFVNQNARAALKLGHARGVVLLAPARFRIPVAEYAPNVIKKSVVGAGHAQKQQVQMMVRTLLPGCLASSADAADALAVAICHAHHRAAPPFAELPSAVPSPRRAAS